MTWTRLSIAACLAVGLIALRPAACRAGLGFTVNLDTSSLTAANGPRSGRTAMPGGKGRDAEHRGPSN